MPKKFAEMGAVMLLSIEYSEVWVQSKVELFFS